MVVYILHMWQTRIELKYYSVVYLNRLLSLKRCGAKLPLGAGPVCTSLMYQILHIMYELGGGTPHLGLSHGSTQDLTQQPCCKQPKIGGGLQMRPCGFVHVTK